MPVFCRLDVRTLAVRQQHTHIYKYISVPLPSARSFRLMNNCSSSVHGSKDASSASKEGDQQLGHSRHHADNDDDMLETTYEEDVQNTLNERHYSRASETGEDDDDDTDAVPCATRAKRQLLYVILKMFLAQSEPVNRQCSEFKLDWDYERTWRMFLWQWTRAYEIEEVARLREEALAYAQDLQHKTITMKIEARRQQIAKIKKQRDALYLQMPHFWRCTVCRVIKQQEWKGFNVGDKAPTKRQCFNEQCAGELREWTYLGTLRPGGIVPGQSKAFTPDGKPPSNLPSKAKAKAKKQKNKEQKNEEQKNEEQKNEEQKNEEQKNEGLKEQTDGKEQDEKETVENDESNDTEAEATPKTFERARVRVNMAAGGRRRVQDLRSDRRGGRRGEREDSSNIRARGRRGTEEKGILDELAAEWNQSSDEEDDVNQAQTKREGTVDVDAQRIQAEAEMAARMETKRLKQQEDDAKEALQEGKAQTLRDQNATLRYELKLLMRQRGGVKHVNEMLARVAKAGDEVDQELDDRQGIYSGSPFPPRPHEDLFAQSDTEAEEKEESEEEDEGGEEDEESEEEEEDQEKLLELLENPSERNAALDMELKLDSYEEFKLRVPLNVVEVPTTYEEWGVVSTSSVTIVVVMPFYLGMLEAAWEWLMKSGSEQVDPSLHRYYTPLTVLAVVVIAGWVAALFMWVLLFLLIMLNKPLRYQERRPSVPKDLSSSNRKLCIWCKKCFCGASGYWTNRRPPQSLPHITDTPLEPFSRRFPRNCIESLLESCGMAAKEKKLSKDQLLKAKVRAQTKSGAVFGNFVGGELFPPPIPGQSTSEDDLDTKLDELSSSSEEEDPLAEQKAATVVSSWLKATSSKVAPENTKSGDESSKISDAKVANKAAGSASTIAQEGEKSEASDEPTKAELGDDATAQPPQPQEGIKQNQSDDEQTSAANTDKAAVASENGDAPASTGGDATSDTGEVASASTVKPSANGVDTGAAKTADVVHGDAGQEAKAADGDDVHEEKAADGDAGQEAKADRDDVHEEKTADGDAGREVKAADGDAAQEAKSADGDAAQEAKSADGTIVPSNTIVDVEVVESDDSQEAFILGDTHKKTVDEESDESEEEVVPVVDPLGRLAIFRIAIIQRTQVRRTWDYVHPPRSSFVSHNGHNKPSRCYSRLFAGVFSGIGSGC